MNYTHLSIEERCCLRKYYNDALNLTIHYAKTALTTEKANCPAIPPYPDTKQDSALAAPIEQNLLGQLADVLKGLFA